MSKQHFYASVMMVVVVMAYAICFTAIKIGLAYAPPFLFAGLRTAIGGLAIWLTLPFLGLPLWPERKLWPWIFLIGGVATLLNYSAMFLSIDRGLSAGLASILGNMQPLFIVIIATMFLGENLTRTRLWSLALGILGIILISSSSLFGTSSGLLGLSLAITTSVGASVGSILMKGWQQSSVILPIIAWQFIVGSLPLLAFSFATETPQYDYDLLTSTMFIFVLLLLALVGTAFGTATWYWLIQRHEIGRLSLYFFLVPVFGLVIASMSGETFSRIELLGAAIIIVAILVSLLPGQIIERVTLANK